MTAHCIPKHIPRNGILFSLAYFIAEIFPSIPLSPNPPGTKIPSTPLSSSLTSPVSTSSALTHLILTFALLAYPP